MFSPYEKIVPLRPQKVRVRSKLSLNFGQWILETSLL